MNSCIIIKKKDIKLQESLSCLIHNNSKNNYIYYDFPNRDINFSNCDIRDEFVDGYLRTGQINNGFKEGLFFSRTYSNFKKNSYKEEFFKKGLRDSIFRQFDSNGKIIYETTFKKGTGLWKEFHNNGELYFEMYTKDGYFTDTLRLHDDKGNIIGKRLYKKDSLIYSEGASCFPCRNINTKSD